MKPHRLLRIPLVSICLVFQGCANFSQKFSDFITNPFAIGVNALSFPLANAEGIQP